jgi:hypothetical protein
MGLDMYLYKQTYVQNWDHMKPEERIEIILSKNTKGINPDKISYIIEKVGYWRKANAIHGWIVEQCADGVDDCQEIHVSKQKLDELLQLCCSILGEESEEERTKAALEKLPPTSGFFFGSAKAGDEWYVEDLKNTIRILEEVLAETDFVESKIIYQASW